VDYYYNRGILYCRLEEYQEALSDFNKVLEWGFGRGFGLRIQPRELTKEEKVSFLKNEKKFLEEKVLRVGEQLKDFEKPLGKTKNKPLMKDFKNKPLKKVVSKNKRVKK
jgi:tetratricopeptide (TPR) repeat protein